MKICFVISDIKTEACGTTVVILKKAHERGHKVYVMSVGDFIFHRDENISLRCKKIPASVKGESVEEFWEQVQDDKLKAKAVPSTDMDVVFLRNNPTEETSDRHWAEHSGIAFARMIQQSGVLVLNDAFAMSHAFIDKLYFEELPAEIKPDSLITRNKEDLLEFWERMGKKMVLKPLEGSGGQDVYLIDKAKKNLNQIVDTISAKGYIIAQEFLPEVSKGDVRVILMNGKILEENGEKAIIRRVNSDNSEFRSNLSLGAKAKKAKLTPEIEKIVSLTAPKLIRDGLFFVGLDIVNDKLIEINVLSPGGLDYCENIKLPAFTDTVVEAIERKIEYKKYYKNSLTNKELATMD
ncbi:MULTISPECIES: glutathione synthase [Aequorivita]|uniref:Glutathione synthase n=2 Tax=Aequorivita TaxID=153265 RepID=A0AB35YL60_9FLAO|nr:glutathione synthase [Aequorivita sp. Ant34-E75]WGF92017.1 glutathione synthase [Aequorivita sp. Ant34-E75]